MPNIHSDEWIGAANAELARKPCKLCEVIGTASVSLEFIAKPLGTWSLAGMQDKTTGSFAIIYRCSACNAVGQLTKDGGYDGT